VARDQRLSWTRGPATSAPVAWDERPGSTGSGNGGTRTVALMIASDGSGSARSGLLHLAQGLRGRGFRVVPILPPDGSEWLAARLRQEGFRTTSFHVSSSLNPGSIRRLSALLQHERVNVAHAHEFTLAVHGTGAAVAANIPSVITMHGDHYQDERLYRRVALRWAAGRSRAVVAVSRATARDLAKSLFVGPSRIEVVPNGIAPATGGDGTAVRCELGIAPREAFVLGAGGLRRERGHRMLVRALSLLRDRRPDLPWTAAIAGTGEEHAALAATIEQLGLGDRVRLLGHRSDVADLLRAADVFVVPSLEAGLPVALLEAMLAGKAAVASRVDGVSEVIRHGETGLLVPPERPEELSAALERLVADPALQMRLGATARREAAGRFSVDAMVDAYVHLYGFGSGED
jgi:glycosyltransferase involved in cell wall biosynthesis